MHRSLALTFLVLFPASLNAEPNIEWPAYGSAPGGGHYSTAIEINKQNVGDLEDCPKDLRFPQNGSPYCVMMAPVVSNFGAPCTRPPWATLDAIDLASGDILWRRPLEKLAPWPLYLFIDGGIEMGSPMVTKGGLIFIAATSDGYIRAFDIDDGTELWKAELPTTGNSVPMTYTYSGHQFVVVTAGGHFTSPLPSGDHVMAFKLPD